MRRERTCAFTCALLLSVALAAATRRAAPGDTSPGARPPLLGGAAVGVDLCGLAMKAVGAKFANMEVMGRLNLREKYFPVAELGIGDCSREGSDNDNTFSVTAPYFRLGMDYNFNKKPNGNRFFAGARYAFSSYDFDVANPTMTDPCYGLTRPVRLDGQSGKSQWLELCVGLEAKLWSIVRMGWDLRMKARLGEDDPSCGAPYFVPGYGRQGSTCWGGTVRLMLDVGKSMRRGGKKRGGA